MNKRPIGPDDFEAAFGSGDELLSQEGPEGFDEAPITTREGPLDPPNQCPDEGPNEGPWEGPNEGPDEGPNEGPFDPPYDSDDEAPPTTREGRTSRPWEDEPAPLTPSRDVTTNQAASRPITSSQVTQGPSMGVDARQGQARPVGARQGQARPVKAEPVASREGPAGAPTSRDEGDGEGESGGADDERPEQHLDAKDPHARAYAADWLTPRVAPILRYAHGAENPHRIWSRSERRWLAGTDSPAIYERIILENQRSYLDHLNDCDQVWLAQNGGGGGRGRDGGPKPPNYYATARRWAHGKGGTDELSYLIARRDPIMSQFDAFNDGFKAPYDNHYRLHFKNGTLDARNGSIRPGMPEDMNTRMMGGRYVPGLQGEAFNRYLAATFPDPCYRAFMKRFVGMVALSSQICAEHGFWILLGTGANGKGVFERALELGLNFHEVGYGRNIKQAILSAPANDKEGMTPVIALRDCRLSLISAEIGNTLNLDEACLKRISGGDTLTDRFHRQNYVSWKPTHTCVLSTNILPNVASIEPIRRRVRVLPFTEKFEGAEDTTLDQRIRKEADAVATWIGEGAIDYMTDVERNGRIIIPTIVREATADYCSKQDSVRGFLNDRCRIATDDEGKRDGTQASLLYKSYKEYCKDNQLHIKPQTTFGEELARLGYASKRTGACTKWAGIYVLKDLDAYQARQAEFEERRYN